MSTFPNPNQSDSGHDQPDPGLTLSVIIATRNRPAEVRDCLESLMQQTHLPDEIIIVDASDTSDIAKLVEKLVNQNNVPIAYVVSSPGLTRQRNIGIGRSTGDIILFLDDDVVLYEDYVAELMRVYESDGEGVVGGAMGISINEYRGSFKHKGILGHLATKLSKWFLLPHYGSGRLLPSAFPSYHKDVSSVQTVEVLNGCNMSFQARVFEEIGGFDEWFEGYSYQEDDDLSFRVSRKYQLLQVPAARLVHKATPTARQPDFQDGHMKTLNHYYVFAKHHSTDSRLNWAAFLWSELGRLFFAVVSLGSLKGLILSLIGLRAWANRGSIWGRIQAHIDVFRWYMAERDLRKVFFRMERGESHGSGG